MVFCSTLFCWSAGEGGGRHAVRVLPSSPVAFETSDLICVGGRQVKEFVCDVGLDLLEGRLERSARATPLGVRVDDLQACRRDGGRVGVRE